MRWLVIGMNFIAAASVHGSSFDVISTTNGRLVRDEFPWPFLRVPMADAPRSIVIPLATNMHVAFDVKTLRTHAAWVGGKLNLGGYQFNAGGGATCAIAGTALWTAPAACPWQVGSRPQAPTAHPPGASDFREISTESGVVTLAYDLDAGGGEMVRVRETPRVQPIEQRLAVTRRFELAPHAVSFWLLAHSETGRLAAIPTGLDGAMIQREKDCLLALVRGAEGSFRVPLLATNMAGQIWIEFPPSRETVTVEVASLVCTNEAEIRQLAPLLAEVLMKPASLRPGRGATHDSPSGRSLLFRGSDAATRAAGDGHYARETFPAPRELDLLVGGMDWLPDGRLVLSTWPGEVYIVEGATGPVSNATYRRFASGLHEPLGLKVINGQIHVVQKCELTRLTDSDGDGEADLYESLNDDWGFDGDMHYFAYGPALDAEGNFHVSLDANTMAWKPKWELPFRGWTVKISPDGRKLEGVSAGFRSPNGCFNFAGDIFATDNEGHWLGTCKVNHCRAGKYFGYPSSTPMPREVFQKPGGFDPPAVWLPRKLSTSASGGVEIPDERFGPFRGQLLVGDFGTSSILRVALEKVNGEWQGAVWPFAKGFLSGVNRLSFGPDGKLYVGCLRRGWSSSGPQEFSLERVSYAGGATNAPFEIREVRARPDGFELRFTEPIDPASAASPEDWNVSQFGYKFSAEYGSPECDHAGKENSATPIAVTHATVSPDARQVELRLNGWKAGFVTAVQTKSVRSARGRALRHDTFYYTLNKIPKSLSEK